MIQNCRDYLRGKRDHLRSLECVNCASQKAGTKKGGAPDATYLPISTGKCVTVTAIQSRRQWKAGQEQKRTELG